jgi:hypothetical protein
VLSLDHELFLDLVYANQKVSYPHVQLRVLFLGYVLINVLSLDHELFLDLVYANQKVSYPHVQLNWKKLMIHEQKNLTLVGSQVHDGFLPHYVLFLDHLLFLKLMVYVQGNLHLYFHQREWLEFRSELKTFASQDKGLQSTTCFGPIDNSKICHIGQK